MGDLQTALERSTLHFWCAGRVEPLHLSALAPHANASAISPPAQKYNLTPSIGSNGEAGLPTNIFTNYAYYSTQYYLWLKEKAAP